MSDERRPDATRPVDDGAGEQPDREKTFARRALLQAGFALPLALVAGMPRKAWSRGVSDQHHHDHHHHDHHDHHHHDHHGLDGRTAPVRGADHHHDHHHHDHHDHHGA